MCERIHSRLTPISDRARPDVLLGSVEYAATSGRIRIRIAGLHDASGRGADRWLMLEFADDGVSWDSLLCLHAGNFDALRHVVTEVGHYLRNAAAAGRTPH